MIQWTECEQMFHVNCISINTLLAPGEIDCGVEIRAIFRIHRTAESVSLMLAETFEPLRL